MEVPLGNIFANIVQTAVAVYPIGKYLNCNSKFKVAQALEPSLQQGI